MSDKNGLPKQCPSCGGFGCGSPCQYGFNKSDPIAAKIQGAVSALAFYDKTIKDVGLSTSDANELAKQIRQQLGRELLERKQIIRIGGDVVTVRAVREVCQLEETKDE